VWLWPASAWLTALGYSNWLAGSRIQICCSQKLTSLIRNNCRRFITLVRWLFYVAFAEIYLFSVKIRVDDVVSISKPTQVALLPPPRRWLCKINQPISLKLDVMIGLTNRKNCVTFGGDPVPDTDSGSFFHFYHHCGIRNFRTSAVFLRLPADFHDTRRNDWC